MVLVVLAVRALVEAVVAPLVLRNLLRLHPVVVIACVLMGAELFGPVRAFFAAPVATAIAAVPQSVRAQAA